MEPGCSSYLSRWSALLSGRTRCLFPKLAGWASSSSLPQISCTHQWDQWPIFTRSPKCFAQLFSFQVSLSVQRSHCSRTCLTTLLLIRQHYSLHSASPGEWMWRRGLAESSWGIAAMHPSIICGLTQWISPFWQLNYCGYHLLVH